MYTVDISWGRGQAADWMRTDMRFGSGRRHIGETHVMSITRDLAPDEVAELMVHAVSIAVNAMTVMLPQLRYVPTEEFDRLMKENGP